MLLKLEFSALGGCLSAALLLAGCGAVRPPNMPPPSTISASQSAVPALSPANQSPATPVQVQDLPALVLAYADQVRALQGSELAQEIARLNDSTGPDNELRLAMALVQTRQLYDLARAQDVLQRLLANAGPEARSLHPLARLLAMRLAEQRRAEDQADRLGSQLRDTQRRLDQTNDKLEALKEIERSLTSRPAAQPGAASTRSRARSATP